ncbi:hypothetical protein [Calothrix sp. NIES-2098]|uniref:hypothetical protein n=1 Tax=Calothrix sp. NIES-2098 TaxID=1954171 RepID=UPI000B608447|nr:hypothetical protein NIES2098_34690 [Calothrix sp. NIES-2098]
MVLDAGFANLEKLIKNLNLSVSIDYDRIAGIVSNAVNGLGDLIISSHRSTREIINNHINSAHQSTREVIVNILSPKLEAGFANLEKLVKNLKLTVDYDRIAKIVDSGINRLGDFILSSHETTRTLIINRTNRIIGRIVELSEYLEGLLKSLKLSVDYDKIKNIVDGAHNFTRGIILAALGGITAAVAAAIGALVPVFTVVVETAAATIAASVRQAAAQLAVQLESIIRRLLRDPTNNPPNDSINWQTVTIPIVSCNLADDGKYTPSTSSQTITVIATKTGNEVAKTLQHFQELAKSNEQLCRNRNNEAVALVALPERYELSPGGHIPQMIYVFKQVNDDETLGRVPYQITVPHPANTEQPSSAPLPNYKKGSWEGILTLKDNSKVFVNAYSLSEAETMLDAIKPLINSSFLTSSFQKVGQRKGQALLEINVKLVEVQYYPEGTAGKQPQWIKRF